MTVQDIEKHHGYRRNVLLNFYKAERVYSGAGFFVTNTEIFKREIKEVSKGIRKRNTTLAKSLGIREDLISDIKSHLRGEKPKFATN